MALITSTVEVLLEMAASTSGAVVVVVLVLLAWAAVGAVVFAVGVAVAFVPVLLATMAGTVTVVALAAMLAPGAAIVAFPMSSLLSWSIALSSVASSWVTTTVVVVLPLGLCRRLVLMVMDNVAIRGGAVGGSVGSEKLKDAKALLLVGIAVGLPVGSNDG